MCVFVFDVDFFLVSNSQRGPVVELFELAEKIND